MTATTAAPEIPGLTFVRPLGSGGYADVYLYLQARPRRQVAVKVLSEDVTSEAARAQFSAEADAMAALAGHPNIVQVFSTDVTADGRPYLVMEYYPAPNLAVRAKTERLDVAEVLRIGVQIAGAVETAHRAGILHRDIKPANVLTSRFLAPGLTDFGIATTGAGEDSDVGGMSVPWSPPEVIFSSAPAGRSADVYSLGATIWHLLAGHSPFEVPGGDNSSSALAHRILSQPAPRTGREDVPSSLERVLGRAMAKDPASRPATALELARMLQGVESDQGWARTELVVMDDSPAHESGGVTAIEAGNDRTQDRGGLAGEAPPTRRRAIVADGQGGVAGPLRSVSRSPVPRSPAPLLDPMPHCSPALAGAESPARPSVPAAPPTVRRPAVVAPSAEETTPRQTEPASRRKFVVAGAGVLAVALAVGGALALAGGGGGRPTTRGSAAASSLGAGPQDALAAQAQDPGTPRVTWTRVDTGHVKFAWTYDSPLPGDQYRWEVVGQAPTVTSVPVAIVADPVGSQRCVQVQVGRKDGSAASGLSDPVCGG
ncbi:protein kinase [Acidiferrimicrobium sp. IK]|uniref:serine/threonine-protein kinase n=1 Tax=Acidiferrimicrobium sp. IK TaxID=2871700 RepID=UPI0021CAF7BD|nr:serine/threonine-protein kinase [Acidiferrimicrobium sp. IK]MCU4185608.1 protein kinase [Acidiferrimicrobium sp. IK]